MFSSLKRSMSANRFVSALFVVAVLLACVTLFTDANVAYASQGERKAVVSSLEGSVLIQAAGKATALPAKQGMELKAGDRIITGKDGKVEIKFDDGSVSRVAPSSRIDLAQLSKDAASGGQSTVLDANWGKVWNKVQEVNQQNSRFEVNTPSAVAGVRGTGFAVEVGMGQGNQIDTLVRVYEGLVGVLAQGSEGGSGGDQTLLSPFQQALIAPQAPPPQPTPLNVLGVDNWEKDNLVEDVPEAYIEVEIQTKDVIAEQLLNQTQEQRIELALLAAELEQLIKLQQEAEGARRAELERLAEQARKEMELRRDGLRAVEHERQKLVEERQQLQQVRDSIQTSPPNLSPRELQQQIKAEAKDAREAERANEQQRQERQSLIQEKLQQAQQARQEAQRQAEAAVMAQLEQARQQVLQSLLQEIRQAQSMQQFQQILGSTFGQVVNEIMTAPSTDTRVPAPPLPAPPAPTTSPPPSGSSGESSGGGGDDSGGSNLSSNANLSSLSLGSAVPLHPEFSSSITAYSAYVDNSVDSVTVQATKEHWGAYVVIKKGSEIVNGNTVELNVGNNIVDVIVTAENGTIKTYRITVSRASNEISLMVNPPAVNYHEPFYAEFTLTVVNDTILESVSALDIILGGAFAELSVNSLDRVDETRVTASVYGTLTNETIGNITIKSNALAISELDLTVDVTVNMVPFITIYEVDYFDSDKVLFVAFSANQRGTVFWAILPDSEPSPDAESLINGTVSDMSGSILYPCESECIVGDIESFDVIELELISDEQYNLYLMLQNEEGNSEVFSIPIINYLMVP